MAPNGRGAELANQGLADSLELLEPVENRAPPDSRGLQGRANRELPVPPDSVEPVALRDSAGLPGKRALQAPAELPASQGHLEPAELVSPALPVPAASLAPPERVEKGCLALQVSVVLPGRAEQLRQVAPLEPAGLVERAVMPVSQELPASRELPASQGHLEPAERASPGPVAPQDLAENQAPADRMVLVAHPDSAEPPGPVARANREPLARAVILELQAQAEPPQKVELPGLAAHLEPPDLVALRDFLGHPESLEHQELLVQAEPANRALPGHPVSVVLPAQAEPPQKAALQGLPVRPENPERLAQADSREPVVQGNPVPVVPRALLVSAGLQAPAVRPAPSKKSWLS